MSISHRQLAAYLLFSIMPFSAWSFSYNVNVNTSNFQNTAAILAFDFISNDGATNNSVMISNFLTDGSYDPLDAILDGDVSGDLTTTVNLGESSFFNELLQPIVLGNSLSFQLDISDLFNPGATTPDSFAFYILDDINYLPLFTTTDFLGADALFAIDFMGDNSGLSSFTASNDQAQWSVVAVNTPPSSVPTPGTLSLLIAGGLMVRLGRQIGRIRPA